MSKKKSTATKRKFEVFDEDDKVFQKEQILLLIDGIKSDSLFCHSLTQFGS